MTVFAKNRMSKYPAVLEIKVFLYMADDVTFVEKKMKISNVLHIKMKIHKIVSLAFFSIFLYENLQIYKKHRGTRKLGQNFEKRGTSVSC